MNTAQAGKGLATLAQVVWHSQIPPSKEENKSLPDSREKDFLGLLTQHFQKIDQSVYVTDNDCFIMWQYASCTVKLMISHGQEFANETSKTLNADIIDSVSVVLKALNYTIMLFTVVSNTSQLLLWPLLIPLWCQDFQYKTKVLQPKCGKCNHCYPFFYSTTETTYVPLTASAYISFNITWSSSLRPSSSSWSLSSLTVLAYIYRKCGHHHRAEKDQG